MYSGETWGGPVKNRTTAKNSIGELWISGSQRIHTVEDSPKSLENYTTRVHKTLEWDLRMNLKLQPSNNWKCESESGKRSSRVGGSL